MSQAVYEALRDKINTYSIGFNATKSGTEIEILKKLFTVPEAKLYLHMSRSLLPVSEIAKRAGISETAAAETLANMTRNGATFPKKKNGVQYYAAAPFIHGLFENSAMLHAKRPHFKELATLMHKYMSTEFKGRGPSMRTIPVNLTLNPESPILPYSDVKKIIETKEKIGLFGCACAEKMKALESGCTNPKEVCMGFDFYAEYAIEGLGVGRWITRQEALAVLEQAEKDGLVHQIGGDSRNVEAICNCCPDCCGVLQKIKSLPAPAKVATTDYRIALDSEACINCLECLARCPMEALTEGDETIALDPKRCIGCGLCATVCPTEALTLTKKPADQQRGPFDPETYRFMRSTVDFEKDLAE